ncbi:MAG TPA: hypothetical protein VN213_20540 [Solirubrobacteraceae bacterium]|nr:hypothetical protein [Solirubrobacteraceae bacterium]
MRTQRAEAYGIEWREFDEHHRRRNTLRATCPTSAAACPAAYSRRWTSRSVFPNRAIGCPLPLRLLDDRGMRVRAHEYIDDTARPGVAVTGTALPAGDKEEAT